MPRARNIKYAFFENDELAEIDPLGRLFFIGLWTIADWKGNFIWREKKLKTQILPYDNCDIKEFGKTLSKARFIRFYSDQQNIYCNVVNFTTHQNPHTNEKKKQTKIPDFTETMAQAVDLTTLAIISGKIGTKTDNVCIDRADSLSLIPDPCSLKPDPLSLTAEPGTPKHSEKESSNKKQATEAAKEARKEIWESYKKAYFTRYATEPVGNAKVYTAIKQIHERIGEEAKHVAAFYVTINDQFLIKQSHALGPLLSNCEGYTTQWRRGQAITSTVARQVDKSQSNMDAAAQVCAEIDRENGNAN